MSYTSLFKAFFLFAVLLTCTSRLLAQGCPPNIDFEDGNLTHWHFYTGKCCPINTPVSTAPVSNIHTLTGGPGTDKYGNFPVVAPGGGQYSLRLGNDTTGGAAERATYFIHVPVTAAQYFLVYHYAVVLQDPGHIPEEQPRFEVTAYDSATGNIIDCASFSYIASSSLPGFQKASTGQDVYYKPWDAASLDLTAYKGKTVTLTFATGDCGLGAHFGYAYIDIDCKGFNPTIISCNGVPAVTLKAPPGFNVYDWRDATLTTTLGSTQTITIPTPVQTTTYKVILAPYSGFGCPDTVSVQVVISNIQLDLPDTTACNGSDVQLDADAWNSSALPFSYSWSPPLGLSCTNCRNPVANTQESMTYTVVVTDTSGCIQSDTVRVTRVKLVSALIQKLKDTVCQYAHNEFTNIAVNPSTASHFWNLDTNGHIYSGDGTPKVTGWWGTPGPRRIIVRVSDADCNVWDTVNIYVKPGPYAFFDVKPDVCLGEEIKLLPAKQDAWYYWSAEGQAITDTNFKTPVIISYNTLGRKHIVLTVKGFNGCLPPPYDTVVTVREFPLADIQVVEKEICYGDTVTLNTIKSDRYIYSWTPVLSFVTNSASAARAEIARPLLVHLEVSNQWGCRSYDSAYIMPEHCCNVYFPDAFTPNGDGLNDRFRPISAGHHDIKQFMIANRWGRIIYESTDQYSGWDGTCNGEKQDYGMYFYYLKYDCTDGETLVKKGSFLLIR